MIRVLSFAVGERRLFNTCDCVAPSVSIGMGKVIGFPSSEGLTTRIKDVVFEELPPLEAADKAPTDFVVL